MPPPFDVELALRQHGHALHQLVHALLADRSAADDVVAGTFAAALQRPPRDARSIGGWLRVAAHNLARKWRRSEQRRRTRELQAARGEAVEDAAAVVAREELLQRVVDAVKGLDQPYREAIWQRWFEELTPTAIAAQSGVPLATVKSRLQRGLQMLRARLSRDEEEGEWRTALAAVFGVGGGVGVESATGAVLMGTGAKLIVGTAAVLMAATWWWAQSGEPLTLPVAGETPAPIAAAATTDLPSEPFANERQELRVAPSPAPAPAVHLRGRIVAAESGLPLAGCRVHSTGRGEPVEQTTAADGRFDLAVHGEQASLEAEMPGRAHAVWSSDFTLPLQDEDLGDFALQRGVVLRGRVVDERDLPVPDFTMMIWDVPEGRRRGDGQKSIVGAKSDANGEFAFEYALPVGEWKLVSWDNRRLLLSPQTVVVDPPREVPAIVVRTAMQPSIEGIVVDDQGAPVAGVAVAVAGKYFGAGTDAAGHFRVVAPQQHGPTARLAVTQPGPFDVPPPTAEIPWGTTGVRIGLLRPLQFELRVVDDVGQPVEEFGLVCRPIGADGEDPICHVRGRGRHPGGRMVVDHVRRGPGWLRVVPASVAISPSDVLSLAVTGDTVASMQVVLHRRDACAVRVLDAAGAPVVGAVVELIRSGVGGPSRGTGALDPRTWIDVSMPDSPRREQVDKAQTGADGTCRLWVDRDRGELTLTVKAADHAPLSVQDPRLAADGELLTVRLEAVGHLRGRVELGGVDRRSIAVRFLPVGGQAAQFANLQPDGSFVSPLLPVGDYRVTLTERVVFEQFASTTGQHAPVPELEQRVRVTEAATTELHFTAPVRRLATLHGRILVDGAVPDGLRVDLLLQRDDAPPVRRGEFAPGRDGSFVATDLLPGRWRLGVRLPGVGRFELPAVQHEPFDIADGDVLERSFAVVRRRLVVHLQDQAGRAVGGGVLVQEGGWTAEGSSRDGTLVFDPAPLEMIRFARQPTQGEAPLPSAWSDPVQMPQDRTEAEVSVTVPGRR